MARQRHDSWQVDLLDQDDQVKLADLGWSDGTLKWDQWQAVQGTGQITLNLDHRDADRVDWARDRIRIGHRDGDAETRLGVWLMSITRRTRKGPIHAAPITLSDKTELLNKPLGSWLTHPKGSVPTTLLGQIIATHAGTKYTIPASAETLDKAMTWQPEDRWLTVANDLAKAIGYTPLYATDRGLLASKPIIPPLDRPITANVGSGDGAIPLLPDWEDVYDRYNIPTGVRIYVARPNGTRGWIGAADLPAEHPLSAYTRGKGDPRGHERLLVESGTYTSSAKTQEAAERRLAEAIRPQYTITTSGPIDGLHLGDIALLEPHGVTAELVAREIRLGTGAVVASTWQAIYPESEVPEWE